MSEETHNARCECGAVQLKVRGPLARVLNCHCSQCRRSHGVYGAYTRAARTDVTVEAGDTITWYDSSDFARRGFCARCGSNVFYDAPARDYISISAGLFEVSAPLEAEGHIFVGDKPDFYELNDDLPKHARWLDDPQGGQGSDAD